LLINYFPKEEKMKRFTLALVAVVLLSTGTASADRGWWFGGGTGDTENWYTIMNIVNYGSADAAVTVTFYDISSSLIGSTVRTISANETWNFGTNDVGNIVASSFDTQDGGSRRGSVNITSDQAKNVVGYTTIFQSATSSGFNFRIPDLVENP
jgi:hypothetical protein